MTRELLLGHAVAAPETASSDDELLRHGRSLLCRYAGGWRQRDVGIWTFAEPPNAQFPRQGWKLHVTSTLDASAAVLEATMPLLVHQRTAFKFVNTKWRLALLNGPHAPLASAGKFITIYPSDDARAVELAGALDRATRGVAGPRILSDHQYAPGSLVHYRYGAFIGESAIDDAGRLVAVIRSPDGRVVPDRRSVPCVDPDWVVDPFGGAAVGAGSAAQVLLNGRYAVRRTLGRRNKGGIYLGTDCSTGRRIVIKEGRPHVDGGLHVGDARSLIHREANVLRSVASLGLAPRLIDLFDQQDHAFLVEEHVVGAPLRIHVLHMLDRKDWRDRLPLVTALAELMQAFHDAGVVLRDFTPNNVMVLPDGRVRLVDLELAMTADVTGECPGRGTPGYCSWEQLSGLPASVADDHYSLGATIAYVATGLDPDMPPKPPAPRSDRLERMARDGALPDALLDVVRGCTADDPGRRWSPRDVLAALSVADRRAVRRRRPAPPRRRDLARAASEACAWLASCANFDHPDSPWPSHFGGAFDPRCVHTGAAGVGLVLCRACMDLGAGVCRETVRRTALWITDRLREGPRPVPGLHFGLSGVAWFLTEAAGVLDDGELLALGSELAIDVPVVSSNPDMTHGTAGVGMAQLRHWQATGDERFLVRAAEAADDLVRRYRPGDGGRTWQTPGDFASATAGRTMYGFAHGSAGICHFLLCASVATGEHQYRDAALEGLEVLLTAAHIAGERAMWPVGPRQLEPLAAHWCHGSAGIGSTLIRAYAIVGDVRYRRLAEMAARAVVDLRWNYELGQCHGTAGHLELLMDLHHFLGDDRYRAQALRLGEVIWSRRLRDRGHMAFPNDSGFVTAEYDSGLAGIASCLLRLTYGGPRMLMLDELSRSPSTAETEAGGIIDPGGLATSTRSDARTSTSS